MKMELSPPNFNARHWRTLQAICACSQIYNWSTWCLEILNSKLNLIFDNEGGTFPKKN